MSDSSTFKQAVADIQHGERKHPWKRWTDGDCYKATQNGDGEDSFDCKPESFVSELRAKATALGMKVHVRNGFNSSGIPTVGFEFYTTATNQIAANAQSSAE